MKASQRKVGQAVNSREDEAGEQALAHGDNLALCLFCEGKLPLEKIFNHLNESHELNMLKITKEKDLSTYSYIKFVNYVTANGLSAVQA